MSCWDEVYVPLASTDVEHSISHYKNILSDRRQSLTWEDLTALVVFHCFH